MSRIPPTPRSALPPPQQTLHDTLTTFSKTTFSSNFIYLDKNDALIGPFPFILAEPATGQKALECISSIAKIPGLPEGLDEGFSVAYDVARELVGVPGPLIGDLWQASVSMFGKEGTVALGHYVGFCAYICIAMLNGVDAKVPEDGESVL